MSDLLVDELTLTRDSLAEEAFGDLFHSVAYHRLHADNRGVYFRLLRDGQGVASIHFTQTKDGLWRSPARGTFAGWTWHPDVSMEQVEFFMHEVESRLESRGARRLEVLPPPMAHDPERFAQSIYLMHAQGWSIVTSDVNQSLCVEGSELVQRMSTGNAKRLRKCRSLGMRVEELPGDRLPDAHQVIVENRAAKDRNFSMSLDQLQQMKLLFPDDVLLFGCALDDALVAAAVCLRLNSRVLYVFAWGHLPEYATSSPVVLLADEIHGFCHRHGFALLDLGTSTVGPVPNHGLLRFKRGIGCSDSLKVVLRKEF